jgi:CubicO group peptidase (beta-lactamase class C family)
MGRSICPTSRAIAAFERTLISFGAPYDYRRGDAKALDAAARRGRELFEGSAGCAACHSGLAFSDGRHHDLGLATQQDRGLIEITGRPGDDGHFRTPGLRNVALGGPWLHDGRAKTLGEAIAAHPGAPRDATRIADLVAFFTSLTDLRFIASPIAASAFRHLALRIGQPAWPMLHRRSRLRLGDARMTGLGLSEAGLAQLRAGVERHVGEGFAPGAVGLVARGDQVETFAVGASERGGSVPVQRDTIFRIASMTKPITAAAVMMLVDEGRLRLDDPIERWLPELADRRVLRSLDAEVTDTVPAIRSITVRDLLTYQLGWGIVPAMPGTYPIQRAIAALGIVGFGPPDPSMPFDNDEWMRRLGSLPLLTQPGTAWHYTTGSNIQGVLVARVSGRSLGAFLEERLFGPLGMADTGFSVPPAKIERFVPAHVPADGRLVAYDDAASGSWSRPPTFEQGDAGLVSTVDDYLAFARMLLGRGRIGGKRFLSEATIQAMTTNALTPQQRAGGAPILAASQGWGFGLAVALERDGNGANPGAISWNGGLGTSWISDPATGLTAVLLTQRMFDSPVLPDIHREFQRGAHRALA